MLHQLGNSKLILGIDLNDQYMQISYRAGRQEEIETVSCVAGEENFNIPVALCKREGVNQWYYGKEAIAYAQENGNIVVTDLLSLALDGETIRIDGEDFSPVALLSLFMKRSLSLLSYIGSMEQIAGVMITCRIMDLKTRDVLAQVMENIGFQEKTVAFQEYTESFYYYMQSQPKELWFSKVSLFDYRNDLITCYSMECNRRTRPMVAYVDEREYKFTDYEPIDEGETIDKVLYKNLDNDFLEVLKTELQNQSVSSVYLIGEQFDTRWLDESLKYLCRGRRVFQGNNLYSKGACNSMVCLLEDEKQEKEYVFLKADKLKSNIGVEVMRQGQPSYVALMDAGETWYEAENELDLYVKKKKELGIIVQSLTGKGAVKVLIPFTDMEGDLNRIRLKTYMKDENHLAVEITNLGLGEFRPGDGQLWTEEIAL